MKLTDIVNFNADASCLASDVWMDALNGGRQSTVAQWLMNYVNSKRPVVMGFTGATVADFSIHNPEALDIIRDNRDIFQIIARPFSHDAALMRTPIGFQANFTIGLKTLQREFGEIENFYLPPEFMMCPEHINILAASDIWGIAINPNRFRPSIKDRIPSETYLVGGLDDIQVKCIPVKGELTYRYLDALDAGHAEPWNTALANNSVKHIATWRDGESPFFFPDGIERERRWLASESKAIKRQHLNSTKIHAKNSPPETQKPSYHSYPFHSMSKWLGESRMLGYSHRLLRIESDQLSLLSPIGTALWLQCINSDIMAAVEKGPVDKTLTRLDYPEQKIHTVLHRSERAWHGHQCLHWLEEIIQHPHRNPVVGRDTADMAKVKGRIQYISNLLNDRLLCEFLANPLGLTRAI